MRKLTLCVLILLCPFHWGIAQGNLKKAASAAAKRLEPKVKTLPRLQAAQPGSQTAKSGAVNKWKMQTGRPLAVHPGVPPGANSLKEYTLDFDALFPAQYMDALQEPTLFDKGFSSSETSSLEERLLQARNNRLHALEKWLWRSRLDYFEKHMLQIAETMLTFTLDGPVNYLRYIPSDTRILFLGEIHYSANIKKEINSLLFQIRAARPKQKIFLFSEFLPQGYQLPPGQDLPDFLKKEYGFEVYQVAHDLNIHLVGLEDASLVASLSKQEFSDDYAGYVDGTVRRNEAWVRPLRQFMEREPEALFIVYAGGGHVDASSIRNFPSLVGEKKSYIIDFDLPHIKDLLKPIFNYVEVPAEIEKNFLLNKESKLIFHSTNRDNRKLFGFDLSVTVHITPEDKAREIFQNEYFEGM